MTRAYFLSLLSFIATMFAVGQVLALETLPGEPEVEGWVETVRGQAVPPDEPRASGRVLALDPAAGRLTQELPPVPHLLPEGGTRVFRVKDPALLKGVNPGDKVRFEVERNGRSYLVTRVENRN